MDKFSIIRMGLLILTLANQVLAAIGKSPLPISNEELEMTISTIVTIVLALYTGWKNNYLSARGRKQKDALEKKGLYKTH